MRIDQFQPIAITGLGCYLPGAENFNSFRKLIENGETQIQQISSKRSPGEIYMSNKKGLDAPPDSTYTHYGATINEERINTLCKRFSDLGTDLNRLELLTLAALDQIDHSLNAAIDDSKYAVLIGGMNCDERERDTVFWAEEQEAIIESIANESSNLKEEAINRIKQDHSGINLSVDRVKRDVLSASIIDLIRRYLKREKIFGGLVDAACASSLAAIEQSCILLQGGSADVVISGGVEANLSPESFITFARLSALAEKASRPFDNPATGLSQGEGAVLYELKRLDDAEANSDKIYGVIRGIGSSSDGAGSGIFQPSVDGQLLAYERCYLNADKNNVQYIEAHGTGTQVGDETEIRSLSKYFTNNKTSFGSAKFIFGHTKGAAGAIGILRILAAMQEGEIHSVNKYATTDRILTQTIKTESDALFGVSSFGFGGINYHCLLSKQQNSNEGRAKINNTQKSELNKFRNCVISKIVEEPLLKFNAEDCEKFRLPKQIFLYMDDLQRTALQVVMNLISELGPLAKNIDFKKLRVVSASCTTLDRARQFSFRSIYSEIEESLRELDESISKKVAACREHHLAPNEDIGASMLNNVIAGRVCNYFNIQGANFNFDAEHASLPVALRLIQANLTIEPGLVLLLAEKGNYDSKFRKVKRHGLRAILIGDEKTVLQLGLPVKASIFEVIQHG